MKAAVAMAGAAFAGDPQMEFFFAGSPVGVRASSEEFFSILMRARQALVAPVLVATEGGEVVGLAMGYDTSRAEWPRPFTAEWERLEAGIAGLAERFEAYEELAAAHRPAAEHFYLGVLAVHPAAQGKGVGRALVNAFCVLSRADSRSAGVYLETATGGNVAFYRRNGFELRGEGSLGDTPLWCLFRPT